MNRVPTPRVVDFNNIPDIWERNPKKFEWRKNLDSMPKRWATILKNKLEQFPHDITFSVGEEAISCHKLVLSVASPFFEELIKEESVIKITGIDAAAFKNIIQYAYQDDKPIEEKDVVATMSAAHLCEIPELEYLCANRLRNMMSVKNAVSIFQAADWINNVQLRESAYGFILKNFHKILDADDFLLFKRNHLCEFLASDERLALPEIDVFKNVIRWGEHQCKTKEKKTTNENLKNVLAGILCHINIASISSEEFTSLIEPRQLFGLEETNKLLRYFLLRKEKSDTNLLLEELKLFTFIRQAQKIVNLDSHTPLKENVIPEGFDGSNYLTRFRIDGDQNNPSIYLKGIGVAGIPSQSTKSITLKVEVFKDYMGPLLSEVETSLIAEPSKIIIIELNKSVRIFANKYYGIRFNLMDGGLALSKNLTRNILLYKLSSPINLTICDNHFVYSLKFSSFE